MGVLASASLSAGPTLNGWLVLFALVVFLVAAVVAWVVAPRAIWATAVAFGLALLCAAWLLGS